MNNLQNPRFSESLIKVRLSHWTEERLDTIAEEKRMKLIIPFLQVDSRNAISQTINFVKDFSFREIKIT